MARTSYTNAVMAAGGVHISISAEPISYIGNFAITNSMFTSVLVSTVLIAMFWFLGSRIKDTNRPDRLQAFTEMFVDGFRNFVKGIVETDRKTQLFTPLLMSFFVFILFNNWAGLLPGVGTILVKPESIRQTSVTSTAHAVEGVIAEDGELAITGTTDTTEEYDAEYGSEKKASAVPILRPGTADLNTTIALALISVAMTQVYGVMFLKLGYFGKFFNFSSPILFFVGLLELILEFAKIASFAFRLFGNIFAGEVLLEVIKYLVPLIVPMPFIGLELFVGFIQALVFVMLSVVFFNMATQSHGEEHH